MTSLPLMPEEWQRLRELREGVSLTHAELAELEQLLERADAHEAAVLAPQTENLRAENEANDAYNRQLEALLERRRQLTVSLKTALETARAERFAIDRELQSLLQNGEVLSGARR